MATLTESDKTQLRTWINTTKHLKRIYKATIDGLSADVFHKKCDNKGATVTICWNTDGCVFGGYTAIDWKSTNTIVQDTSAFIFTLYGTNKTTYTNMWVQSSLRSQIQIYQYPTQGPSFGIFVCFKDPTSKTNGVFQSNGAYNSDYVSPATYCNNNFNYREVEVYQIVDKLDVVDEPWRQEIQEKTATIKKTVEDYKPIQGGDVDQCRILMVGCVGAGKSSYFNTINSVFRGHVTSQAAAGSAEHSLTTKFRSYQIRNGSKYLKVRLCDTRGLEESQGVDPEDITAMLDGHMPNKYSVGYLSVYLNDKIHCSAFIIDGTSVDVMNESILTQFKMIQKLANQRGIPQVIILTKVDEISQEVKENLSKLFYSREVAEVVDKVSQLIGLPRGHVLPVKNYEKETELNETVDRYALLSLQQMLRFADDCLYDLLDD
ncbi:hypothetical protein LOTGIDRAFT_216024 [Lottia gigantea]|uniref:TLDc domain-containing protein n=1 Tax=Lottia gigantea TaxID=225164 RepID=V4AJA3_LOTGI|nr:hypothetical protein LOTGIDRAFT_216024 [Lottia gigantea]ESO93626.1 hypothetical protein LOTGIDRAFT_216024 [Lottia gigantea]